MKVLRPVDEITAEQIELERAAHDEMRTRCKLVAQRPDDLVGALAHDWINDDRNAADTIDRFEEAMAERVLLEGCKKETSSPPRRRSRRATRPVRQRTRLLDTGSGRAGIAAAAVLLILGVAGIFRPNGDSSSCIITGAGAKLCGQDAAAYCRTFVTPGQADIGTELACSDVGVDLTSDASPVAAADVPALTTTCMALGARYSNARRVACHAAAEELNVFGSTEFSGDQSDCIRSGGEPLGCVDDY